MAAPTVADVAHTLNTFRYAVALKTSKSNGDSDAIFTQNTVKTTPQQQQDPTQIQSTNTSTSTTTTTKQKSTPMSWSVAKLDAWILKQFWNKIELQDVLGADPPPGVFLAPAWKRLYDLSEDEWIRNVAVSSKAKLRDGESNKSTGNVSVSGVGGGGKRKGLGGLGGSGSLAMGSTWSIKEGGILVDSAGETKKVSDVRKMYRKLFVVERAVVNGDALSKMGGLSTKTCLMLEEDVSTKERKKENKPSREELAMLKAKLKGAAARERVGAEVKKNLFLH
jgi:hypothetical protein